MSSSEQETISTFRSADLPKVCIPADFESSMESSGSDNEGDFIFKVPTTPTDLTPATSLGSTLSQVALSSQTSENRITRHQLPQFIPKSSEDINSTLGGFGRVRESKENLISHHLPQSDYRVLPALRNLKHYHSK